MLRTTAARWKNEFPGASKPFYGEPFNFWLVVEAFPAEEGIIIFFRDMLILPLGE